LIKAFTPVFTEHIEGFLLPVVVYHGYTGIAPHVYPLIMDITTEKDESHKTEGLLRLFKDHNPKNRDWVLTSKGENVTVVAVVAILGDSSMFHGARDKDVIVRIGIHQYSGIYDG